MVVIALCWRCGSNIYKGDDCVRENGFYTCEDCLGTCESCGKTCDTISPPHSDGEFCESCLGRK